MVAPLGCALWIALLATPSAERTLIRADSLFLAFQPVAALALLDSLAADPNIREDAGLRLDYLLTSGKILAVMNRPLLAEPPLREALALAQSRNDSTKLAPVLRFLAYVEETKGESERAQRHYRQLLDIALKRNDQAHEAFGRLGLAYGAMQHGEYATARAGYERAVEIFRQRNNTRYELIALTGLARCLGAMGDIATERGLYEQVVDRARELGDPYQEAHGLNNLGRRHYLVGDPAIALEFYAQSAQLFEQNGDPLGMVTPMTNQGLALSDLGRLDEAKQTLRRALAICRANGFQGEAAAVLEQLATVQLHADRPDSAAFLYRECLRLPSLPIKTQDEGRLGLARALAARDSTAQALELLQFAGDGERKVDVRIEQELGALLLQQDRLNEANAVLVRVAQRARAEGRVEVAIASLTLLARVQRQRNEANAALASLQQASQLWEAGRGRSLDPQWREQLGKDARALYGELASLLASDADPARSVFDALQRFKARTLQERLRVPSGVAPDSTSVRPPVTLAEVQASVLHEGELLLDVFLGEAQAFVLAVDRKDARLLRLDPKLELPRRVARWLQLLTTTNTQTSDSKRALLATAATSIAHDLLDPLDDLLQRNRRILFVPDGAWNGLPLEVLAETHEIVRLPSATLLAELRANARLKSAAPTLCVVAGFAPDLPALPSMRREAERLVKRFELAQLLGQATPLQPEQLEPARLLHFAAHIQIDSARPWRSAIRVAMADSHAGGRLEASQVANLELTAQLAFLSGCESASGQVLAGEGVLGLSAAFLAAGVPTVIATLWPVHDRVASRCVESFYNGLAAGETAAASLRQAQARLRAEPSTRDPQQWAAFVLIGEGDVRIPLQERAQRPIWPWALFAAALAATALWMLRRARV